MSERGLRDRRFWVSSGVIFVDETLYTAILPLLPVFASLHGLSTATVGVLVAGYPMLFFLAALPTGLLVDRVGIRPVLLAGTALLIVSTLLFAFAESAAVLLAARCVQGFASGITSIAGMVAIARTGSRGRRGSVIGAASAVTGLSTFAGPILGGYIAPFFGVRVAFVIPAVLGGLVMVMLLLQRWEAPAIVRKPALFSPSQLRDPLLVAGLMCISVDAFAAGAAATLVPLRLSGQGLSTEGIGTVMLVGAAIGLVGVLGVGRLVDRAGPLVAGGLWLAGVLLVIGGLSGSDDLLLMMTLFALLIPLLRVGGTLAYVFSALSRSTDEAMGANFGAMMSAWALGATVGPLVAGLGTELVGYLATMLVLLAIAAGLGAVMVAAIRLGQSNA